MLAKAFLIFNGVVYLALAAWCTLAPAKTSEALGFGLNTPSSRSEYIVVYGGLEAAMAAFFLLCAFRPNSIELGLWYGLITYGCLTLWRIGTLVFLEGPFSKFIYAVAPFEAAMAIVAGVLLWRMKSG